nr:hypothetical protein [Pseudoclavibacter sp. AY1F1]
MTTSDGDKLDAGTGMGLVSLHVGDLAAQSEYYRSALALEPISESNGEITLGRGSVPLVRLRHTPGLPSRRAAPPDCSTQPSSSRLRATSPQPCTGRRSTSARSSSAPPTIT